MDLHEVVVCAVPAWGSPMCATAADVAAVIIGLASYTRYQMVIAPHILEVTVDAVIDERALRYRVEVLAGLVVRTINDDRVVSISLFRATEVKPAEGREEWRFHCQALSGRGAAIGNAKAA